MLLTVVQAELFGDPVVVHLTNATAEEKEKMDYDIKHEMEAETMEHARERH